MNRRMNISSMFLFRQKERKRDVSTHFFPWNIRQIKNFYIGQNLNFILTDLHKRIRKKDGSSQRNLCSNVFFRFIHFISLYNFWVILLLLLWVFWCYYFALSHQFSSCIIIIVIIIIIYKFRFVCDSLELKKNKKNYDFGGNFTNFINLCSFPPFSVYFFLSFALFFS